MKLEGKRVMKRITVLIGLVCAAVFVFFFVSDQGDDVNILNARAFPVAGRDNLFVVTLEVQNNSEAKTLANITSPSASMVHVMNPDFPDAPLVIPANSSGIFAMDGAHIMLMGVDAEFEEGQFLPLTLSFAQGGEVTARVLNSGGDMGGMDHSLSNGIRAGDSPRVSLTVTEDVTLEGGRFSVEVENFRFVRKADDAPHVQNEGHAHIYLNGLKLGRLYDSEFTLGAVAPGDYDLTVSLNANTHQPYVHKGEIVHDTLSFAVAERP